MAGLSTDHAGSAHGTHREGEAPAEPPLADSPAPDSPSPADSPAADAARLDRLPAHTRAWFVFLVLWLAGCAAVALVAERLGAASATGLRGGGGSALHVWVLALMCFYLTLCNSFLPLPTAWIVLLAASDEFALVSDPWLRVPIVAGLATLGTVIANLNEYHILAFLLHRGLGRRIRRTRVYAWAARWFDRSPFLILLLAAFFPIPVDALRWLAVLRAYPRGWFALAYLIGRGPRYALFAACAVALHLTTWQIMAIQAALVVVALGVRVLPLLWRRRPRPGECET